MNSPNLNSRFRGALVGMHIGDALAMPVHWYYDRKALAKDYGTVKDYLRPRNPHPESEMWQQQFRPTGTRDRILHDQSRYWGKKGIHYHQFLKAGENTLNVRLCRLLIRSLKDKRAYDPQDYLGRLTTFMLNSGSHRDTYIDEYLRAFFKRYAEGIPLKECGIPEKHLSGLIGVLPIVIFYYHNPNQARALAREHVALTHKGPLMETAASLFIELLLSFFSGAGVTDTLKNLVSQKRHSLLKHPFFELAALPDTEAVDGYLGTGCFVDESFPVVVYLLIKYRKETEKALIANTNLGGNNAARGAILGALLGAANGLEAFPDRWVDGLLHPPEEIFPCETAR